MKKRIDFFRVSPPTFDGIAAVGRRLADAFPDHRLKALVELRVSQLNGCAYCVNMHSGEARKFGESQQRLDCLPVWREVDFFSQRERVALAWAESLTMIANDRVPEGEYQAIQEHFSDEEIVNLTAIVGLINFWNRISIGVGSAPVRVADS